MKMKWLVGLLLLTSIHIQAYAVDNFSLFTFPKSGTHILIKLFRYPCFGELNPTDNFNLQHNPNLYLSLHFLCKGVQPSEQLQNKVILGVRDLRAVALSLVEWHVQWHILPFISSSASDVDPKDWFLLTKRDQIAALLKPEVWGQSSLLGECDRFREWIPYLDSQNLYLTSFEKLVGAKGGGTIIEQENEVRNIAEFLNIFISGRQLLDITNDLFGNTYTFRHGSVDRWKEIFDEELDELAEEHMGDLLRLLGYL